MSWARTRRSGGIAAFAVTAVVLAGCTAVTPGTAQRAIGGPAPGAVDVALLDHGNYPVVARKPLGVAGTPAAGALLDAQRMANFVTGPWEADPALITARPFGFSPGAMPLKADPTVLDVITLPVVAAAGARNHYVYGFAAARQAKGAKIATNAVLRMATPEDAATAARDMAQALRDAPPPQPEFGMAPVPIAGHPDTAAVGHAYTDYDTKAPWNAVEAYTPHGTYVLMQRVEVADTPEAAAGLIGKLLDVQSPRIDQFVGTDPAGFAELPRDPDGLLTLSLPLPPGPTNVNNNATYGPAGALHYQVDPVGAAVQLRDAGVDAVATAAGWVYRSRDPAAAAALSAQLSTTTAAEGAVADEVPNLPGSRCSKYAGNLGFYCTASAGRYAFEVTSAQLKDVHQQAAAQYLLLAAS